MPTAYRNKVYEIILNSNEVKAQLELHPRHRERERVRGEERSAIV
jgi:hypothetical protein